MRKCQVCATQFEIADLDRVYFKKLDVPEPKICGTCRQTNLMLWRNERTFYNRKCEKCGADVIACFSPSSPYKVFCNDCWWAQDFNPLQYGREFDFSKPFFNQLEKLMLSVPMGNLFIASSENSAYSNYAVGNKNCYICVASDYNEDSFYVDSSNYNRNVCDVTFVNKNELCYEGVNLDRCYNCQFSRNLKDCNNCFACSDCSGCSDCIGSVGMRNVSYRIFNKKYSKEEYQKEIAKINLGSFSGIQKILNEMDKIRLQTPFRYSNNINVVNCAGNYLVGCKDCVDCYDMHESVNCKNVVHGYKAKDCRDCYGAPNLELGYNSVGAPENYKIVSSVLVWPGSSEVYYSFLTRTAKNCFGCISLHNNEYCILNKQYTKEEYSKIFEKIKTHMKKTGEWGSFFPANISPWGYNETIAQDYYPRKKDGAIKFGAKWEDNAGGTRGKETLELEKIPDNISSVDDKILNEILSCAECSRNYRIVKQELAFYKKLNLPLPRKCGVCRYRNRMALRNPRRLWERQCMCKTAGHTWHVVEAEPNAAKRCGNKFKTTYSPERKEIIWCDECYVKETY